MTELLQPFSIACPTTAQLLKFLWEKTLVEEDLDNEKMMEIGGKKEVIWALSIHTHKYIYIYIYIYIYKIWNIKLVNQSDNMWFFYEKNHYPSIFNWYKYVLFN